MQIKLNPNRHRNGIVWMVILILVVFVLAIYMVVVIAQVAKKKVNKPYIPKPDEVRREMNQFSNEVFIAYSEGDNTPTVVKLETEFVMPDFFVINGPSASMTDFSNAPSMTLTPDEFDNWKIPATNVGCGYFQKLAVYTNLPPGASQ